MKIRIKVLLILFVVVAYLPLAEAQPTACISDIKNVDIDGAIFHYIECGQGEPVIFVHGTLGDYRSWINQVGPFSEGYRVISYSRRYHYPNPWPKNASDFSATIHAKDLTAFINAMGLEKVHLVGHSYGALTSLLVARDNPELVRSLTLGEPPVMPLLVTSTEGKTVFENFMQNSISPSQKAFEQGKIEEGVQLFVNGVLGEGSYEQMPIIAHISMLENARELMGEMNSMNTNSVDFFPAFSCNDAQQIKIPTLLVEGELSPTFLRLIIEALERCIPNNKHSVIPGASHDLKIQEPIVFGETVLPFLDGN